jgi:hypothetical protein
MQKCYRKLVDNQDSEESTKLYKESAASDKIMVNLLTTLAKQS